MGVFQSNPIGLLRFVSSVWIFICHYGFVSSLQILHFWLLHIFQWSHSVFDTSWIQSTRSRYFSMNNCHKDFSSLCSSSKIAISDHNHSWNLISEDIIGLVFLLVHRLEVDWPGKVIHLLHCFSNLLSFSLGEGEFWNVHWPRVGVSIVSGHSEPSLSLFHPLPHQVVPLHMHVSPEQGPAWDFTRKEYEGLFDPKTLCKILLITKTYIISILKKK